MIACDIYIPLKITIISIYLPNDERVTKEQIRRLFQQVSHPLIVKGDFNSHNPIWGSSHRDSRGKFWEEMMNELNLNIMNNGKSTHFLTAYRSFSAIDLTLSSQSLTHLIQ